MMKSLYIIIILFISCSPIYRMNPPTTNGVVFSSVNFKINTILTQSELEQNITEPDFKRDIPENLNINSSNISRTPIKKNLSIRKPKKNIKSEFFKNSKQTLMLEEEYLEEKKNKKQKIKAKKRKIVKLIFCVYQTSKILLLMKFIFQRLN